MNGKFIGDYVLQEKINKGAFGQIWKVRNYYQGTYHALKLVRYRSLIAFSKNKQSSQE